MWSAAFKRARLAIFRSMGICTRCRSERAEKYALCLRCRLEQAAYWRRMARRRLAGLKAGRREAGV